MLNSDFKSYDQLSFQVHGLYTRIEQDVKDEIPALFLLLLRHEWGKWKPESRNALEPKTWSQAPLRKVLSTKTFDISGITTKATNTVSNVIYHS